MPKPATLGSEELPGYGLRHDNPLRPRFSLSTDLSRSGVVGAANSTLDHWSGRRQEGSAPESDPNDRLLRRFADMVFVRPKDKLKLYWLYERSAWQQGRGVAA